MNLAPDFRLPSASTGAFSLGDFLSTGGLLLVFYRGHWCPYCRRYLAKLQKNFDRFAALGLRIAAISPEPLATSRALQQELGLTFPLLADQSGDVIASYGVRNGFLGAASTMPHPAVFLIDRNRAVRFSSIDKNYKRRTRLPKLLDWAEQMRVVRGWM